MTFLATSGVATLGGRVWRFEAPILPIAVFWAWTKGTSARRAWLPSVPRAVTGRRVLAVLQSVLIAVSLLILSTAADVLAAPITGANQADPSVDPNALETEGGPDDLVIEFTVDSEKTTIFLPIAGVRTLCVTLTGGATTRYFEPKLGRVFNPQVPSRLHGKTSGHIADLLSFTKNIVIFRPRAPNTFTLPRECFEVDQLEVDPFEGCFWPKMDFCDFHVREGQAAQFHLEEILLDFEFDRAAIRNTLIRIALNQPPDVAPIITAADSALTTIAAPEASGPSDSPAGPTGQTPPQLSPAPIDTGGSGGGEVAVLDVLVPNVIGLTEAAARTLIIAAGLTVGTVTAEIQTECVAGTEPIVINQSVTGTAPPTVNLVLCALVADIPEPSSLALFATGLGLLILLTWWRRRST